MSFGTRKVVGVRERLRLTVEESETGFYFVKLAIRTDSPTIESHTWVIAPANIVARPSQEADTAEILGLVEAWVVELLTTPQLPLG